MALPFGVNVFRLSIFILIFQFSVFSQEPELHEAEDKIEEENDVLILKSKNFDEVITSNDIILVEFYAPWCGHCKNLIKEYEPAARRMKKNDPPVPFAKVDATVETELATRFSVSGYPTLKIFRKGLAHEYDGPRTEEGIVSYMQQQADPDWKPPPESVIVLTQDNFTDFVTDIDIGLVEFYAPWCGHCKRLAPEYDRAARKLKQVASPIPLAKVDATVETGLAKDYNVEGYPTLKIFRKGKAYEYKGPQDERGIADYMVKQSGDASTLLTSLRQVQLFMSKDDVTIIGAFKGEDEFFKLYIDTCNDLRDDYKFGHSFDADILKAYSPDSIFMFQPERYLSKYEPKNRIFHKADGSSAQDLMAFYSKYSIPLLGERNHVNSVKRYTQRPLVVVYYTLDWSFEQKTATQFWREKILSVAKDYSDITFAISDEDTFQAELKELGLDDSGEEINIALYDSQGKRYRMEPEEDFEPDVLRDFVEKFKAGKLKPHIRSQPAPKKNDGPVKVVVGKTFRDIVLDKSKDVLIEFYAPWCGHCKKLEPIYAKLGKKFKEVKDLVIAKMDATVNDAPGEFVVEGFPTIYFATKENKETPIKFAGERDLNGLSDFIEKHSAINLQSSNKDEL